jgi:hypothetical protein
LPGRVELVQVPAQPVDDPGPFGNQIIAVVGQQTNVAGRPIESGGG